MLNGAIPGNLWRPEPRCSVVLRSRAANSWLEFKLRWQVHLAGIVKSADALLKVSMADMGH